MECDDQRLLHEGADRWRDLMDIELVPVLTSELARARAMSQV
jgi:hypothetical protein